MTKLPPLPVKQKVVEIVPSVHQSSRFGVGLANLTTEWKELFQLKDLHQDVVAGFTVACVAIPLSLAIALASGVSPAVGLVTAVVTGIVCALFGGTPLAVSGPAAAMAVLVASVVQETGPAGLIVVVLGCGLLQVITGLLGGGKLARFVPAPVIMGFTAGIGAIILIGQLPRALGLPPPDQAQVLHVLQDLSMELKNTHYKDLVLVLFTLAIIFGLPRITKPIPAPLVAVVLPSIAAYLLGLNEETIGEIPRTLPLPRFPDWPSDGATKILTATFMVYALASLETLLSSSAVDKIARSSQKHEPNRELFGQGLGNIVSSLFGGLPSTGVIARSALNVQSGARTRRAAVFHSLILLTIIFFFSSFISQIPVSVLAGVLLSVAIKMLNPKELIELWKVSKVEAGVYLLTFFVIVFVDLIVGVQAGVAAALLMVALRLSRIQTRFHASENDGPYRIAIDGPVTFMSSSKIAELSLQLKAIESKRGLIIDLSQVSSIDASGAEQLLELVREMQAKDVKVVVQGTSGNCQKMLLGSDQDGSLKNQFAITESDVHQLLATEPQSLDRLRYGFAKFQKALPKFYNQLFTRLGEGQAPHTLFITCSDSRIDPNLITSTMPGELFVLRNVGNIIPPFAHAIDHANSASEIAALEYAVNVLGIKNIVVCGHSKCGAMQAAIAGVGLPTSPFLNKWLSGTTHLLAGLNATSCANHAARINARHQMDNLLTYDFLRESVERGVLTLHAWFYDIGPGNLETWDEVSEQFSQVEEHNSGNKPKKLQLKFENQVIN